jgi:hypothetical protein
VAKRVTNVTTHSHADPGPHLLVSGQQDPDGSFMPQRPSTVAVPLGPTREHAVTVAEERDVTEWRIHYRHK